MAQCVTVGHKSLRLTPAQNGQYLRFTMSDTTEYEEVVIRKKKSALPDTTTKLGSLPGCPLSTTTSTALMSAPRSLVKVGGKELKIAQIWSDVAQRGSSGYSYCLNKIEAGTDLTQRVGRQIEMQYLDLTVLQFPPVTNGKCDAGRVMVILDTAAASATATMAEILETSVITPIYGQPLNQYAFANRFHILLDYKFPPLLAGAAPSSMCRLVRRIPFKGARKNVYYGGITSDEPSQGALLIVLGGWLCSATGDDNIRLGYSAVLRWTDT